MHLQFEAVGQQGLYHQACLIVTLIACHLLHLGVYVFGNLAFDYIRGFLIVDPVRSAADALRRSAPEVVSQGNQQPRGADPAYDILRAGRSHRGHYFGITRLDGCDFEGRQRGGCVQDLRMGRKQAHDSECCRCCDREKSYCCENLVPGHLSYSNHGADLVL